MVCRTGIDYYFFVGFLNLAAHRRGNENSNVGGWVRSTNSCATPAYLLLAIRILSRQQQTYRATERVNTDGEAIATAFNLQSHNGDRPITQGGPLNTHSARLDRLNAVAIAHVL